MLTDITFYTPNQISVYAPVPPPQFFGVNRPKLRLQINRYNEKFSRLYIGLYEDTHKFLFIEY